MKEAPIIGMSKSNNLFFIWSNFRKLREVHAPPLPPPLCPLPLLYNIIIVSFNLASPAANFWARRMFCLRFHQQVMKTSTNKRANSEPNAMPILAPTDKWGPHSGSPGIPHSPSLPVKL